MTNFEEKIISKTEYAITDILCNDFHINGIQAVEIAHKITDKIILSALAQQREAIVKEIKEEFTYVPVDFYKPSPGAKKYYQEETINGFLDSLTSSVPEEKGDI